MNARRDPTEIGTDEFGNSVLTYYTCKNGTCVEIYDLKCQRRCNEFEFDMRDKNSVIISEERIIIAKCSYAPPHFGAKLLYSTQFRLSYMLGKSYSL